MTQHSEHAPACSQPGCSKLTWDPTGKCIHHKAQSNIESEDVAARVHLAKLEPSTNIAFGSGTYANKVDPDNLAEGLNRIGDLASDPDDLTEEEKQGTLYIMKGGGFQRLTSNGNLAKTNERGYFTEDPDEVDRQEKADREEFERIDALPIDQKVAMAKESAYNLYGSSYPEEQKRAGDTQETRQSRAWLREEREKTLARALEDIDDDASIVSNFHPSDYVYSGERPGKKGQSHRLRLANKQQDVRKNEQEQRKGIRRITYLLRGGNRRAR